MSRGTVRNYPNRPGKPWQGVVKVWDEDSQKWRQATKVLKDARNKTEALKALDAWKRDLEAELSKDKAESAGGMTVADYLDEYIASLESVQAVEPSTIQGYKSSAKYIRGAFGNTTLDNLTASQVQALEADMIGRGLSSSTVGKAHRLLKMVLKHAVITKAITWNPCEAVKPPKRKSTEPNALDPDSRAKVARFIAEADPTPTATGIALALFAGLHSAECCGLKWKDVDLEGGTVRVSESIGYAEGGTYTKQPKNESRRRTIPITSQLKSILTKRRKYMAQQCEKAGLKLEPSMYVLSHDLSGYYHPQLLSKGWHAVAGLIGVKGTIRDDVRFHDLRHSYATALVAEGVDVKTVSSLMGHASAKMTLDVYASSDPNAKREAVKSLERLYGGDER